MNLLFIVNALKKINHIILDLTINEDNVKYLSFLNETLGKQFHQINHLF